MTELKPTKFGISPGRSKDSTPNSKPNRFGQVENADKDYSAGGTPSANEVARFHFRSDADASHRSIHHTLGNKPNQAASGDHVHDGIRGTKLGKYEMDPGAPGQTRPSLTLTGAKGGNAALISVIALLSEFIDFRDLTT